MLNKSFRYSLLLGVVAGLVFSLALWGYELIILITAHAAYPWLPGALGTLMSIVVCCIAALLTHLGKKSILGLFFWVLAAVSIAELLIYVPIRIAPQVLKFFEPGLVNILPDYPVISNFRFWIGTVAVWLSIFFGILGLLQITLVEQAVPAYTPASHLAPFFVFVPVMLLAGAMSSNIINDQLRAPLVVTNRLIQFAIDHQDTVVEPDVARQMQLSALNTVSSLINRPRRLFLGNYDQSYGQVQVLVDFNGDWVTCTTVYQQPISCISNVPQ